MSEQTAHSLTDPLAANATALQAVALRSAMALYAQSLAVSPLAALVSPLKHSLALTSPEPLDCAHTAAVTSPMNLGSPLMPPALSNPFSLHLPMPYADASLLSLLADPRLFPPLSELRQQTQTLRVSDALGNSSATPLLNAAPALTLPLSSVSNAALTASIPTPVATPFNEQSASGLAKSAGGFAPAPVCSAAALSAPDAADSRAMPSSEPEAAPALAALLAAADRENAYDSGGERRGLCVLLSNEHFETRTGMPERAGARIDLENLKRVFGQLLGFELWLAQDLSCREILALLHQGTCACTTFGSVCFVSALFCVGSPLLPYRGAGHGAGHLVSLLYSSSSNFRISNRSRI